MSNPAMYQVVFLGQQDVRAERIVKLVGDRLDDLGVESDVISFLSEFDADTRNLRLPTIAVFLGYDGACDANHPTIAGFTSDSNILVTVVSNLKHVSTEIPECIRHINAIEVVLPNHNLNRIVSLLLEGFRLLRRERRLFISYKRDDSQTMANQLYDALDARGFDVFIDTRTAPPAAAFQAELWHRLLDSDIVILIDTLGFRSSRWTTEELARANATNIQILHLLWPGQPEDGESAFSYFHKLDESDFESGATVDSLKSCSIKEICQYAEWLRARAIAARHRYLVDSFCDLARDLGLLPNVQPQRWISIELASGKELAIVPTVGVPTSDRINQIFDAISEAGSGGEGIWILYDNRGMLASWLKHLEWLDGHLPTRTIRMAVAGQALKRLVAA